MERFITHAEIHNKRFPSLINIFSSGEALPASMVRKVCQCFAAGLHNLYGPTECTIDVTSYECRGDEDVIPIGKPLPGCDVDIIDESGASVPPGTEGELVIGGVLVGAGYKDNDTDSFYYDEIKKERCYKTGDRVVLREDGLLYYIGRTDTQCKINGMRIDLAQIEGAISNIKEIDRVIVLNDDGQLIVCYTAENEVTDIVDQISARLPVYSVPQRYVWLSSFPITPNGKVDKKKLTELAEAESARYIHNECCNEEAELLLEIVERKIHRRISADENIFLAGLDSLKLMDVIIAMEKKGYVYEPEDLYEYKTVNMIVRNKKNKVQWLEKNGRKKLIVAFPYAAGTASAYIGLAAELRECADFCVTHSTNVISIAGSYEKIVLLGYCTGTALAVKAYEEMQAEGIIPAGLALCAALPPDRVVSRVGTPGEILSESGVASFIRMLHRDKIAVTDSMIELFRKDSREFSLFFKERHMIECKKILLCFGRNDMLTWNCKHRWKRWMQYMRGPVRLVIFARQHHFFIDEKKKELARELDKMFR